MRAYDVVGFKENLKERCRKHTMVTHPNFININVTTVYSCLMEIPVIFKIPSAARVTPDLHWEMYWILVSLEMFGIDHVLKIASHFSETVSCGVTCSKYGRFVKCARRGLRTVAYNSNLTSKGKVGALWIKAGVQEKGESCTFTKRTLRETCSMQATIFNCALRNCLKRKSPREKCSHRVWTTRQFT